MPKMIVDFFLDQCNSSWNVETALSVSAIELVIAANNTNKKKMIPIPVPSPILANTLGIVMNIKDGPAFNVSMFPPEKRKYSWNDHQSCHDRNGCIENFYVFC